MVKILGMYIGSERQDNKKAQTLYTHIVTASRNPELYGRRGAADTANGRFELIILHIFMLFRRMQEDDKYMQSIKQKMFDCFLENMDVNLREIGVGPDGVPKRIQKMLENFYGRAGAYQAAIDENDVELLSQVIARNFFSDQNPNDEGANNLAEYVFSAIKVLDETSLEDLLTSNFKFTGE
ncbi:MAG: ubiquinol-cytochrome C chaperone [Hyphomicrobiales bacterium]